ncbi:AraC family transcriptional regulator [Amycolatopsis keratiniphila]|uniref:AraC family transcriptional regulator n=1 Tax=Amycolatopsis keratiniphila TaxID=129921 RepID=UPI001B8012DA|nr:AraC family transcriptional regulator [Amycolatopsis keratiniphila]
MEHDVLSDVLGTIGLRGNRLSRTTLRRGRTATVPAGPCVLHLVELGTVRIAVPGDDASDLHKGDLVLLPHGHRHTLHAPDDASAVPETGARWLTGTLTFDAGLADQLLESLPPLLVLPASSDERRHWHEISHQLLALEITDPRPGGAAMVSRILDLLFIQVLRAWAAATPDRTGWLVAVMDPGIGRALTAIHRHHDRPWTVGELAALANLSRSTFAERFSALVGEPPGAYLINRRLDHATELLRRGNSPIATIATTVGYTSEAAFSRAFRRRFDTTPQRWRSGTSSARRDSR